MARKPTEKSIIRRFLEAVFGDTIDSEDEELFDDDLLLELLEKKGIRERIRKRIINYKKKERLKNQEFQRLLLSSNEPLLTSPQNTQPGKLKRNDVLLTGEFG